MNQRLVLITSYKNPDLDGVACAIAYAEFLEAIGTHAVPLLFGEPHIEAKFVLEQFNTPIPADGQLRLKNQSKVILVDASDLRGISNLIYPGQVIEIIDHRIENQANKFLSASIQIELVGSCATLITEKFFNKKITPSKSAAILLYSAIISNTVNFKASVTTERDKKIAAWLLHQIKLPKNYVQKMFKAKSQIKQHLKESLENDFATFYLNGSKLGVAQFEIIKARDFLRSNEDYINNALRALKLKKGLDYIFLTIVDIDNGNNIFVVIDSESEELLTKSLRVKFKDRVATKKGILMRKTIVPMLRKYLEP
jgi:manganese-dependent inorganic pyrophosphatase